MTLLTKNNQNRSTSFWFGTPINMNVEFDIIQHGLRIITFFIFSVHSTTLMKIVRSQKNCFWKNDRMQRNFQLKTAEPGTINLPYTTARYAYQCFPVRNPNFTNDG